jgi:hypothetical protein
VIQTAETLLKMGAAAEQVREPALIGMEATGNSHWFVEMAEDLGHVVWIGDAAAIRSQLRAAAKVGRAGRGAHSEADDGKPFSAIVEPDREQRDVRRLVLHRHIPISLAIH